MSEEWDDNFFQDANYKRVGGKKSMSKCAASFIYERVVSPSCNCKQPSMQNLVWSGHFFNTKMLGYFFCDKLPFHTQVWVVSNSALYVVLPNWLYNFPSSLWWVACCIGNKKYPVLLLIVTFACGGCGQLPNLWWQGQI